MMPRPDRIPWTRYWVTQGETFSTDALGFAQAPFRVRGVRLREHVFEYSDLEHVPFLALMGESGSGKTWEIEALHERARASTLVAALVDLSLVGDIAELRSRLTETVDALGRDQDAIVFFDSFEECPLAGSFGAALVDVMQHLPLERLKVRLSCRSASWTQELMGRVQRLWRHEDVCAVELLPLTRDDVLLALSRVEPDPERLLKELERKDSAPLLTSPVTLDMVMGLVRDGEAVADLSRVQLYERSMRRLVRPRGSAGQAVDDRIAIARRLAAVTVFCKRPVIYEHADVGTKPGTAVAVADLLGGTEPRPRGEVEVNEAHVRELLGSSGLFSSRGVGGLGWLHPSYSDYLASEYVRQHGLSRAAVASLLRLGPGNGPLAPGMQGVAGWMLNSHPELAREMIARAPEAVLRSDVAELPADARAALVDALLSEAGREVLDVLSAEIGARLNRLAHAGLRDQLRARIEDPTVSPGERVFAIQIALACKLVDLADTLVAVALTKGDPRVRARAAEAVLDLGDEDAQRALAPLLDGDADDHDDELKGLAATAVWPRHLATADLWTKLTRPRRDRGAYSEFLRDIVPKHLDDADLPTALQWAAEHGSGGRNRGAVRRVDAMEAKLIERALGRLDVSAVLEWLVAIFEERLAAHVSLYAVPDPNALVAGADDDARRRLLDALVPRMIVADNVHLLLMSRPRLVLPTDVPWLLDRVCTDTADVEAWSDLLDRTLWMFGVDVDEYFDRVLDVADERPALRARLWRYLGPIEIDSQFARAARERVRYDEGEREEEARQAAAAAAARSAAWAAAIAGKVEGWLEIVAAGPEFDGDGFTLDFLTQPSWADLVEDDQQRIRTTARRFLEDHGEGSEAWMTTTEIPLEMVAGFAALWLLVRTGADAMDVPSPLIEKWLGAIVGTPVESDLEREGQRDLVGLAMQRVPDAFRRALRHVLATESPSHGVSLLSRFEPPWDANLVATVAGAIVDASDGKAVVLLDVLADSEPATAERLAGELLDDAMRADEVRAAAARLLFMRGGPSARRRVMTDVMTPGNPTGRRVVEELSLDWMRRDELPAGLSEAQLADFYVWLEREYPTAEDPPLDRHHAQGVRFKVGLSKDRVLRALEERSTPEAVEAFQSVIDRLPALSHLQRLKRATEERALAASWRPPAPDEVLLLATQADNRLVDTEEQLRLVVVESLARFQQELNGQDTPLAEFLWDAHQRGRGPRSFTPKDEASLSNLIKRHLKVDLGVRGVIVNREIEVSRPPAHGPGPRTDIQVDAKPSRKPAGPTMTVIVEVKRCSNKDCKVAIEEQLIGKYLAPMSRRNGVLVVGYFDCAAHRCCARRGGARAALQDELKSQAARVESAHHIDVVVLDTSLPPSMIAKPTPIRKAKPAPMKTPKPKPTVSAPSRKRRPARPLSAKR